MVRMIKNLWARVSKMWLLGELGMGFFYSAPQDFVMLGVFCACFPPREARFFFVELWVVVVVVGVFKHLIMSLSREESALVGVFGFCVFVDPRF